MKKKQKEDTLLLDVATLYNLTAEVADDIFGKRGYLNESESPLGSFISHSVENF